MNRTNFKKILKNVRAFDSLELENTTAVDIFYDTLQTLFEQIYIFDDTVLIREHLHLPEDERSMVFETDDKLYDYISHYHL